MNVVKLGLVIFLIEYVATQLPDPPNCGQPMANLDPRIIGGFTARKGQFPWIAALGYGNPASVAFLCGGTLITSRHVLTAAHCLIDEYPTNTLVLVRMATVNLFELDSEDYLVQSHLVHPNYNEGVLNSNDIAIVTLKQDADLTKVRIVCLPKTPELSSRDFVGTSPFVAGWGNTKESGSPSINLRALRTPITTNDVCAKRYATVGTTVVSSQVCAGLRQGGKDSCQGDSGGPLVLPQSSDHVTWSYYLIGIVSFGYGCAQPGYPGVYTRVTSFMGWIESNTN